MFVRGKLSIKDGLFIGINYGTITCIRTCQIVNSSVLVQPQQLGQIFPSILRYQSTFSILQDHFYKTPTSVYLLYTLDLFKYYYFINKYLFINIFFFSTPQVSTMALSINCPLPYFLVLPKLSSSLKSQTQIGSSQQQPHGGRSAATRRR